MDVKFLDYKWRDTHTIYCSPNYLKSFKGQYGWIAGYISGELRLVISYTIKTKLIFKMATFQSAPVVITDQVPENEEKNFLNGCICLLEKIGVDFFTQPPLFIRRNSS